MTTGGHTEGSKHWFQDIPTSMGTEIDCDGFHFFLYKIAVILTNKPIWASMNVGRWQWTLGNDNERWEMTIHDRQ